MILSLNRQQDTNERLVINRLPRDADTGSFARDVRQGLTSSPKFLPPKYFYDELGSILFEAICRLPEYYLTRAETEILDRYADEIAGVLKSRVRLVELGSGSAEKPRYLIQALLRAQQSLHYFPIDISELSLERSSRELLQLYPGLSITAYAADYFTALGALAREPAPENLSTIALFLGSNIGNFDPEDAGQFLKGIRRVLRSDDAFLMGADLKKRADVLIPAYDDALGVTAAFNLNLLLRINRELGGSFDVTRFRHRALYNDQRGRVESHLVSRLAQSVQIDTLGMSVEFAEGETIHTENSYKFDVPGLAEIGRRAGFVLEASWYDDGHLFSLNLFRAA